MKLVKESTYKGQKYTVNLWVKKGFVEIASPGFTATVTNVKLNNLESLILKIKNLNELTIEASMPEDLVGNLLERGFKPENTVLEGREVYDQFGAKKCIIVDGQPKNVFVKWDSKLGHFNCAEKYVSIFNYTRQPSRVFDTMRQAWDHIVGVN